MTKNKVFSVSLLVLLCLFHQAGGDNDYENLKNAFDIDEDFESSYISKGKPSQEED
jgi:hypothetical protein